MSGQEEKHFFFGSTPSLRKTPLQPYALGYVVLFQRIVLPPRISSQDFIRCTLLPSGCHPRVCFWYLSQLTNTTKYPGNQQFSPADQLCLTREPEPGLSKELPLWSWNYFSSHATHCSMRYQVVSLSSCYSLQHDIVREIIPKNRRSQRGRESNRRPQD